MKPSFRIFWKKKSIARYEFVGNDQIYWVGHPILSNKKNNNIVIGALFIYKLVPVNEADKVTKILDSYNNYRQTKFFRRAGEELL